MASAPTDQPSARPRQDRGVVDVPRSPSFWRRLFAFSGPAYLVSVGYMDPGNWATDIAAGAQFGYALLWVLLMSNVMAIVLQSMSARLGLVARLDLAQACRAMYGRRVALALWLLAELAITATDLAEVLGSAIGLNLLFGLPLWLGALLTSLDLLVLMVLHRLGMRVMEAFILVLIGTIGICLGIEVFLSQPSWGAMASGLAPSLPGSAALYLAVGMLGATVMPHNLYLHSALVQSRRVLQTPAGLRAGLRFNLIDSVGALNAAFLVNGALLVMAAATFFARGHYRVGHIQQAYRLLEPLLGVHLAPVAFAVALIASGQSSTITGTLAGQIVMEGFVRLRMRPMLRRALTRAMALTPAVVSIVVLGPHVAGSLLVLSQVVLSLQLPFAVVPLLHLVCNRRWMAGRALHMPTQALGWLIAAVIVALNGWLAHDQISGWIDRAGDLRWLLWLTVVPAALALVALLGYVLVDPLRKARRKQPTLAFEGVHGPAEMPEVRAAPAPQRICAAVDFSRADPGVLARALWLARVGGRHATVRLLHVVESGGARALGTELSDSEAQSDRQRLERYRDELIELGVRASCDIGFGDPVDALARLVEQHEADLLIVGAHGHRLVGDLVHGTTIDRLRHRISMPVLVVPAAGDATTDEP